MTLLRRKRKIKRSLIINDELICTYLGNGTVVHPEQIQNTA